MRLSVYFVGQMMPSAQNLTGDESVYQGLRIYEALLLYIFEKRDLKLHLPLPDSQTRARLA